MKKILSLFFLFYIAITLCAKSEEQVTMNKNKMYTLGGYIISPSDKTIYREIAYEKTRVMPDGSRMNVWLTELIPNPNINFKTTSLIFIGNRVYFKEDFPITTIDISSLEVIQSFNFILSPLENKVYGTSQIDVRGYTHIRDAIFKDNTSGKLFYIPYDHASKLMPIDLLVDENSIKHVIGDFYVDKHGLYDFGRMQKLESNHGNVINPILFDRYLIYGNAAYAYSEANKGKKEGIKKIRLDAGKLRQINTHYETYIGDGNILLKLPYRVKNLSLIIQPKDIIQIDTPKEPITDWNNFDITTVTKDKNIAYYPSPYLRHNSKNYNYSLIKTTNGFYGVTGSSLTLKATKLDGVMIYNFDLGDYELIDVSQFKRVTTNFYIYKNRLYYSGGYPVITNIDFNKLEPIKLNGQKTEFYTDGNALFAGYNLGKLERVGGGNSTQITLAPIYERVDWASLHIINNRILADKNNIYISDGNVIRIRELEINVIVK